MNRCMGENNRRSKKWKKTTLPCSTAFKAEWFIKSTFSSSDLHQVSSENLWGCTSNKPLYFKGSRQCAGVFLTIFFKGTLLSCSISRLHFVVSHCMYTETNQLPAPPQKPPATAVSTRSGPTVLKGRKRRFTCINMIAQPARPGNTEQASWCLIMHIKLFGKLFPPKTWKCFSWHDAP